MKSNVRATLIILSIILSICFACFSEDMPERHNIIGDEISPIITLSNFGVGEWKIVNADEINNVVHVEEDSFYMGDRNQTREKLYEFSFSGCAPGFAYVHLYYYRNGEITICLGIELIVDEHLCVIIQEIEALPGAYADYFSGDEA